MWHFVYHIMEMERTDNKIKSKNSSVSWLKKINVR